MISTKFILLLSVFVFLTGCNGGGINLTDLDLPANCGKEDDKGTKEKIKYCEWFVRYVTNTEVAKANGVEGYIPDCVYEFNRLEGKLMDPPEDRNYDFEIANNEYELERFRVIGNYEKIQKGKIYRFTKAGTKEGERGVRMLEEIDHLGEGPTYVKCVGGNEEAS